jgi:hypothetical protein
MHKHTDPASAAAELLKRRSIRNSLAEWARHKGFEPAPHHQLFIREIEAFLRSEDEVLLLFAPPGSAKSTYVSVLLPSWYLAANPTHSILAGLMATTTAPSSTFGASNHLLTNGWKPSVT